MLDSSHLQCVWNSLHQDTKQIIHTQRGEERREDDLLFIEIHKQLSDKTQNLTLISNTQEHTVRPLKNSVCIL